VSRRVGESAGEEQLGLPANDGEGGAESQALEARRGLQIPLT
jgi:hypothetical protein